jgi:hypothetical protein
MLKIPRNAVFWDRLRVLAQELLPTPWAAQALALPPGRPARHEMRSNPHGTQHVVAAERWRIGHPCNRDVPGLVGEIALGAKPRQVIGEEARGTLVWAGNWNWNRCGRSMVRHLNHNEPSVGRESTRLVNLCNRDRVADRGIVAATLIPARRAAFVDPTTALRHD